MSKEGFTIHTNAIQLEVFQWAGECYRNGWLATNTARNNHIRVLRVMERDWSCRLNEVKLGNCSLRKLTETSLSFLQVSIRSDSRVDGKPFKLSKQAQRTKSSVLMVRGTFCNQLLLVLPDKCVKQQLERSHTTINLLLTKEMWWNLGAEAARDIIKWS